MNGGIVALIFAGLVGFGAGAYLAATGERTTGIALMAMALIMQALALRQIKMIKKDGDDAL